MDITPSWHTMIVELIGMIQAGDDATDAYNWATGELDRIGEHLDSLPASHRLPMVSLREFAEAKREILETV